MLSRSATANASTVNRNVIANTRAGIPIQRGASKVVFAMLLGYIIDPESRDWDASPAKDKRDNIWPCLPLIPALRRKESSFKFNEQFLGSNA
jgi:hypothetical protein